MKALHFIASLLVWIGGINWGLMGIGYFANGNWNVVAWLLGSWPSVEAVVYVLVGVSAVYLLITHRSSCKDCMAPDAPASM